MAKIHLENLEFWAYHGVYPEEQKTGTRFIVNLVLEADLDRAMKSDCVEDTIDYTKVYACIEQEMQRPSKLIEHVMHRIATSLKEQFTVQSVEIKICKELTYQKGMKKACILEKF